MSSHFKTWKTKETEPEVVAVIRQFDELRDRIVFENQRKLVGGRTPSGHRRWNIEKHLKNEKTLIIGHLADSKSIYFWKRILLVWLNLNIVIFYFRCTTTYQKLKPGYLVDSVQMCLSGSPISNRVFGEKILATKSNTRLAILQQSDILNHWLLKRLLTISYIILKYNL